MPSSPASASEKPATRIAWSQFVDRSFSGARIVSARADGSGPRTLTNPGPGVRDGDPVWSPDRTQVAFERDFPDHAAVVIVNADGSGEHVLDVGCVSPCQDVNEPSWTPDGTRIAFTLVIGPFDQPGESATSAVLWTAKLDETDVRRLSEPGIDGQLEDGHARFSPDGSFVIFERGSSITFDAAVFRMDIDGTNVRQLTPFGLGADTADLSQSDFRSDQGPRRFRDVRPRGPPSGAREDVAAVPATCLSVTECTSQIRYITANGSGPKDSDNPAWSPDGTQIAFVEYVHPATAHAFKYADIYTVKADGLNRHQVSTTQTWNLRPDW